MPSIEELNEIKHLITKLIVLPDGRQCFYGNVDGEDLLLPVDSTIGQLLLTDTYKQCFNILQERQ